MNSALKQLTEAGCLRLEAVDGNLKNKRVRLTELGEARLGANTRSSVGGAGRRPADGEERSALLALEGKLLDAFRAETEHALTQSAAAQEDV